MRQNRESRVDSREHLAVIPENLDAVLEKAKRDEIDAASAAEALALAIVASGKQV